MSLETIDKIIGVGRPRVWDIEGPWRAKALDDVVRDDRARTERYSLAYQQLHALGGGVGTSAPCSTMDEAGT